MKKFLLSILVLVGLTSIKIYAAGPPSFPVAVSKFIIHETALLNSPKLGVTGLFQTGSAFVALPGPGVISQSVSVNVKIRTSKLFRPVAKHVFTMPSVFLSVERSGVGVVMT